jgi:predicted NUDIX family phosphoesterase
MAAEERVLCFRRSLFQELGPFQGISLDVEKYLPVLTAPENLVYLNRGEAERDTRYKQLIPYVLMFCNSKLLRYRRGKGGQEDRLHGLYSVGIGGHISEEDHGLFSLTRGYDDGMRRELVEEVAIDGVRDATVAVINDDSTEVGSVHFGVVHIAYAPSEAVAGRRAGILAPEFIPLAEVTDNPERYESWSRLCFEHMTSLLNEAAASGIVIHERLLL